MRATEAKSIVNLRRKQTLSDIFALEETIADPFFSAKTDFFRPTESRPKSGSLLAGNADLITFFQFISNNLKKVSGERELRVIETHLFNVGPAQTSV
jgi:hypothetical protein